MATHNQPRSARWYISGLGSIGRVGKSFEHDGVRTGATYTAQDRLQLNGVFVQLKNLRGRWGTRSFDEELMRLTGDIDFDVRSSTIQVPQANLKSKDLNFEIHKIKLVSRGHTSAGSQNTVKEEIIIIHFNGCS